MAQPITIHARIMGSPFSLSAYPNEHMTSELLKNYMQLAFGEVARLEDLLTDFRDSPFNDINKYAGIKPVKVSQEILNLIDLSLQISESSRAAFDISYATVGHVWREIKKSKLSPDFNELEALIKLVDYRNIQINYEKSEVFLPHEKMRIGLGGIGKGYAVDRAYQLLKDLGVENFFINGAGDIRVHTSKSAPRAWKVALRNPFAPDGDPIALVGLAKGAVASSGDYERYFYLDGKRYHHVFDARTGECSSKVLSATVLARNACLADILATTAMILGPDEGIKFLNERRDVSGFLVDQNGKVFCTKTWVAEERMAS